MKGLRIAAVGSGLELEQARDIRRSVLCGECNWPREIVDGAQDEGAVLFLASLGPKPLGTLRLRVEGSEGILELLAVLDRFRGQGIGRELLEAAEAEALSRGLRQLSVAAPNSALFSKLGFLDKRKSLGSWQILEKSLSR
jgi:GNAT superfamily N-acetyltransferase